MKRTVTMMAIAIAMLLTSSTIVAQNTDKQPVETQAKQKAGRISREQHAERVANYIAQELALDDATAQKFITLYRAYQQEMWALNPRVKKPQLTDDDVEKAIRQDFNNRRKLLDIREKYYKEYAKVLTPKQIQRVYEMERQSIRRFVGRGNTPQGRNHRQHRPQK